METYIGIYVCLCVCVAFFAKFRGNVAVQWFFGSLLFSPPIALIFILSKRNLSIRHARPALRREVMNPIPKPLFVWPTLGQFDFELVGAEYYQAELQHLGNMFKTLHSAWVRHANCGCFWHEATRPWP